MMLLLISIKITSAAINNFYNYHSSCFSNWQTGDLNVLSSNSLLPPSGATDISLGSITYPKSFSSLPTCTIGLFITSNFLNRHQC